MDGDFHTPLLGGPAQPDLTARFPLNDLPAYDVRKLMNGGSVSLMVLDGTAYTLRITRAGKLILTK